MEINLDLLAIQNPWWVEKSLEFDPVLAMYESKKLKWTPPALAKLNLNQDCIYALFGPRGVGKTTILKLIVKKLLAKHQPEKVFYYSCHNLQTAEHLAESIKLFIRDRRQRSEKQRLFIIIDEISLISQWDRHLLHLKKAGLFKKVSLILSGSSFAGIEKELKCQTEFVGSLDFADFLKLLNPYLYQLTSSRAGFKKNQDKLLYYRDAYLLTGGFVSAINDFKKYGAVRQSIYSNYLYWLITDFAKMGQDILLWRQIMEETVLLLGGPLKFQTLAKHTKARTHNTVARYLQLLENIFCVKLIYQSEQGQIQKFKAKRIFFRDPFLFWMMYGYIYGSLNYWDFSRECLHNPTVQNYLFKNLIFSQLIKNETAATWNKQVSFRVKDDSFVYHAHKNIGLILDLAEKYSRPSRSQTIIITTKKFKQEKNNYFVPLTYFLLNSQKLLNF